MVLGAQSLAQSDELRDLTDYDGQDVWPFFSADGKTVYYVSQRANDSWLLGLTAGVRKRVYRRGRFSGFVDIQVGISDAAIAAPLAVVCWIVRLCGFGVPFFG